LGIKGGLVRSSLRQHHPWSEAGLAGNIGSNEDRRRGKPTALWPAY
jgi:hypothetical protein